MKLSRRELVALAGSAATALAQTPAPAADPLQTARDANKRVSDALTKFEVPVSTEPAFQFKA